MCIGYSEIQIRLTLSFYSSRRLLMKLKAHVIVCDLVRQYNEIQFYAELKKEKKRNSFALSSSRVSENKTC